MSNAQSLGGSASLYPQGEDGRPLNVEETPADLQNAIDHALKIISWQENLSPDEVPPIWMWTLDHELETWFKEVKRKRDQKCGRSSDPNYEGELYGGENVLYERMQEELREQMNRGGA